jgi:hypothetical protein
MYQSEPLSEPKKSYEGEIRKLYHRPNFIKQDKFDNNIKKILATYMLACWCTLVGDSPRC